MLDKFGFTPRNLWSKARIARHGAVLLGNNFAIDAHESLPVRVVTHAHADHVLELEKSLRECKQILMTPATTELVRAIYGLDAGEKLVTLEPGREFSFGEEKLRFHEAGHVLGSVQVEIETSSGERLVYTGDFKLPKAKPLPCDALVIEATYGNPSCRRPFEGKVEEEFVRLVKASLRQGRVFIFGYHGKLQECAELLRLKGVKAPIVMSERVYRVAKICERHGMKLGEFCSLADERGREVLEGGCIGLFHMRSRKKVAVEATRIYLSGWEFRAPWVQVGEQEYVVALSDHSDFEGLLTYIEQSSPEIVVTDNFRIGDAKALAKAITEKFGIRAKPMPWR